MKKWAIFIVFIAANILVKGQPNIDVTRIDEVVEIDGKLDEPMWSKIKPGTPFGQYFPTDSIDAEYQTELYMGYDKTNLYVGIKCYGVDNDWIVTSLKRDYRAGSSDNITLVFDAFNDRTNAIWFGINPLGVIREGVITNGGNDRRDFDESWDNKWRGEAHIYDGYYTAELEIPFSTLRFNKGSQKWTFGAYRFDTQHNETSTFGHIPRNQTIFSLAQNGDMNWEFPLESTGSNISIIPYIASGITKDYENETPSDFNYDFGGDAKIGVTSGLNLDLTINPDFSQVEVDRQITDLSRFEIFFPERRQFFLENADLFSGFGFSNINPFFSRRIGVARDKNDDLVQNRIYGGARLSGKINNKTRIGLLNMQTQSDIENGVAGGNYSVAAVQRKIWDRSNISFIFVNKQLSKDNAENFNLNHYNRVAGIDFNYANKDNTWFGKTFLHTSFSPDENSEGFSHGTSLKYNTRPLEIEWNHQYVDENYDAEVGFIRRTNYYRFNPEITFKFYPKESFVNELGVGSDAEFIFMPGFGKTDHDIGIGFGGQLSNTGRFRVSLNHEYTYLFDGFDPTGTDSDALASGTEYNYVNLQAFYSGDRRKDISYSIFTYLGGYFNGMRYGGGGSLNFRSQPKLEVAINYNYNLFDMPHLDGTRQTFLIGPRIDYTFSKKLFWTTFIQYNTQSKNTNINSRLQWRFAPVSDFFIVYTDNYFTGNDPSDRFTFDIRNRALVAKFTYWLNP